MRARAIVLALALATSLACGEEAPRTQVMVTIGAEDGLRETIDQVEIAIYGTDGVTSVDLVEVRRIRPTAGWPLKVGLVPRDGDASRQFGIVAIALDASGAQLAQQSVLSGYVARSTRWVHIQLHNACFGVGCSEGETCCQGGCTSASLPAETLPLYADGMTPPSAAQVQCSALPIGRIIQIAAGVGHTCVVYETGRTFCWGRNENGQLGNGTFDRALVPVEITLSGQIAQIAPGGEFSCALLFDGSVMCWGLNNAGQLGDGSGTPQSVEPRLVQLPSPATQISAGFAHACAVLDDATLRCWGINNVGQLGDGTTENRFSPVPPAAASEGAVTHVSAGTVHTCAVGGDGGVACWGRNAEGQVGPGAADPQLVPRALPEVASAARVRAGWSLIGEAHTCAVLLDGNLVCWGDSRAGQTGSGMESATPLGPTLVPTIGGAFDVGAGLGFTCAHTGDGVGCWGIKAFIGIGENVGNQVTPIFLTSLPPVEGIAVGLAHTCALTSDGTGQSVLCWGANNEGQLGNGNMDNQSMPAFVGGLPE